MLRETIGFFLLAGPVRKQDGKQEGVTGGFHTAMGGCCQNPKAASCGGVVEPTLAKRSSLSNISALWDQPEDAERCQAI